MIVKTSLSCPSRLGRLTSVSLCGAPWWPSSSSSAKLSRLTDNELLTLGVNPTTALRRAPPPPSRAALSSADLHTQFPRACHIRRRGRKGCIGSPSIYHGSRLPYCPLKYRGLSWCTMVVVKATMTNHGSIYNYCGTPWLQNILPYSFPPWHHGKNGFRNSKLYFT